MGRKFIHVTMPDNSVWKIRYEFVVLRRAKYYATQDANKGDGTGTYEEIFDHEYRIGIKDEDEILDWAANNLNWSDVSPAAERVLLPPSITSEQLQEGWVNGEKKVVEE